jgi:hypothetical protein
MVARKARRSRVQFLGWTSKPRWSQCRVAAHNQSQHAGFGWFTPQNQHRVETTWQPSHEWDWRGGCTKSAGFAAVHHKTVGVTWLSHKTKTGGSAGGDGIRACQETSKQATHGMIEVPALGGREGPMDARPSDWELHALTKMPLWGLEL